jgi:hypothetical protein
MEARQVLHPFPKEISNLIARQSSQTYSRLARSSSQIKNLLTPAFEQLCFDPISAGEVYRYIRESKPSILVLIKFDPKIIYYLIFDFKIQYQFIVTGYSKSPDDDESPEAEGTYPIRLLEPVIQNVIKIGYQPNIYIRSDIISKRRSCYEIPFYRERYLLEATKQRLSYFRSISEHNPTDDDSLNRIWDAVIVFFNIVGWKDQLEYYLTQLPRGVRWQGELESMLKFLSIYEGFLRTQLDSLPK